MDDTHKHFFAYCLMKQYDVFPECYVDTNLIGYILGKDSKHKSSCNEVVKAVNHSDSFAIGIIDDDKRRPTMDSGFSEHKLHESVDGEKRHVSMFIHEDGRRYIFTIKPAMDKFVWDAAKHEGVSMKDAGYSTVFKQSKKETKRIQAATDPKLRRLFAKILGYPELQRLRNTLKYLMGLQYKSTPDIAKQFFDGRLTNENLASMLSDTH